MSSSSSDADLGRAFGVAAVDRSVERHRHEARRRLLRPIDDATEPGVPTVAARVEPRIAGDRYVVIEPIGRGAMGVVLRAYDTKLQREVALKVVHPGALSGQARARMLREARAMARLSHPNVVAIYDAELEPEGGVAVAMELVRGRTLYEWLATRPPWREVVAMFVAAGRGLAAAHAAGVLHRDFKPTNVLVGDDGRLRVTDFGLARTLERGEDPSGSLAHAGLAARDEASAPCGVHDDELTQRGALLGTPAYMAPEQHEGRPASVATDQFAFCVSLWEGLTGARPFAGPWALLGERTRPRWPRDIHVPRAAVDAITRGLAFDPSARWPTMDALLAVLERIGRRTRRSVAVGAAIVLLAGSGVALGRWSDRDPACAGSEAALAGVWSQARRDAVAQALLAVERPFAADVWQRTQARIDGYATRWIAGHREACEATSVRGEQSAEVLDLRMVCLQRARTDLRVTIDVLAHADARVVETAHTLVDALPPLERCDDLAALRTGIEAVAPELQPEVDEVRDALARARALRHAGDPPRALELAQAASTSAAHIGHAALALDATLELAAAQSATGRYAESEVTHQHALRSAIQHDDVGAIVMAATGIVVVAGVELGRPAEALALVDVARGAADRSGDPIHRADTHDAIGLLLREAGRHTEAELEHRAAIALRRDASGGDALPTARSRSNLGLVLGLQGRHDEAEAEHRAALAITETELGAMHPAIATFRNNLAIALQRMGRLTPAIREYELAIAAASRSLGARHPTTAKARANLGGALLEHGEPRRAVDELRAAIAILAEALGAEHPSVAAARQALAMALRELGAYAEAVEELRVATTVFERALGREHPDVAYARGALASVLDRQGAHAEAENELRAAIAGLEHALGADHVQVAELRVNLGVLLSRGDRLVEAEAEERAALASYERSLGPDHPSVAMALYDLAIVRQRRGALADAEVDLRRALVIREAALGVDHPEVITTKLALGDLALERHDMAAARRSIEAAWTAARGPAASPVLRADLDFALARVLVGEDRPRALALARAAHARYVELGPGEREQALRVARWLGRNRR